MDSVIIFERSSGRYVCNPDNSIKIFTKEEAKEYLDNTGLEAYAYEFTKNLLWRISGKSTYYPELRSVK